MTILEILANAHVAVILDTHHGGSLGRAIGDQAVRAVTKGFGSPEWKSYMSLFADNAGQLERLTVAPANEDAYFPTGRAYIVANGTCGAETDTFTGKGVLPKLQTDLTGAIDGRVVDPPGPNPPDPNVVVRPFAIPRIP